MDKKLFLKFFFDTKCQIYLVFFAVKVNLMLDQVKKEIFILSLLIIN